MLLFVIRDYIGTTPLSNLVETLKTDLTNIWSSLSKPPGLETCLIQDYFDFQFTALPHKILQAHEFEEKVAHLRVRYSPGDSSSSRFDTRTDPDYVFDPTYHKRIPADGIPLYTKQCWDQIVANKDLDLPTQQVLLAQYRCDEIAQVALEGFDAVVKPLENSIRSDAIIHGLGPQMRSARATVMGEFESQAQRYHRETFIKKLEELKATVDLRLHVLFRAQISGLHSFCMKHFQTLVESNDSSGPFGKTVIKVEETVLGIFDREAAAVVIEGTEWTFDKDRVLLVEEINGLVTRLRKEEMTKILSTMEKQIKAELDEPVSFAFTKPSSKMWDLLIEEFEVIKNAKLALFREKATKELIADRKDVEEGLDGVKLRAWIALRDRLDTECEPTLLLLRLRELYSYLPLLTNNSFEDRFRYDEQGVPRIWKPTDDIDGIFKTAREEVFSNFPPFLS